MLYLIEYDGIQHFKPGMFNGTEEDFVNTQIRDKQKNEYCKENGIPLIRIPYTYLDKLTIEDLILEKSQFKII